VNNIAEDKRFSSALGCARKFLFGMQAQYLAAADLPTRRPPSPPLGLWSSDPSAPDLGHDLFLLIRDRRRRISAPIVIEPEIIAANVVPFANGQHLREVSVVIPVRMR
jgi:hypothetical protein